MSPADLLPAQIADALKTREELIGILITADGKGKEVKTAALLDLLMRTIAEVRAELTDPAQIGDGLAELARRDQVSIHLDSHKGQPCHWQVVDSQIIAGTAFDCETRSGTGLTYDAALSACRAATFSGGKDA